MKCYVCEELVVVIASSGGSAKSVFKVSYIVCSSVSESDKFLSSVWLYVSIVPNLGLSVVLQVAVLDSGVSLEEPASVVIVNAAAFVIVDAVVVISDAKCVVVVISVCTNLLCVEVIGQKKKQ